MALVAVGPDQAFTRLRPGFPGLIAIGDTAKPGQKSAWLFAMSGFTTSGAAFAVAADERRSGSERVAHSCCYESLYQKLPDHRWESSIAVSRGQFTLRACPRLLLITGVTV